MDVEKLEFLISQYVDGTLPISDRQIVDDLLQADPDARKILSDYQRLNGELLQLQVVPSMQWDRLAAHLSGAIDDATAPTVAGRIVMWQPRWRIAAGLLVAGTAALIARHAVRSHQPTQIITPTVSSVVSGPQAEVASGAPVEVISVGPSPALAMHNADWRYGEGVVGRGPSKVVLLGALNPPAKSDSNRH